MTGRVLVAGIGNIFFGDDAFGVEVASRLQSVSLPECVRVEDYGIRGVHLAYELLEGYETLVLVDALPMGEPPGTLALVEAEIPDGPPPDGDGQGVPVVDAHTMSPAVVLSMLAGLGGRVGRVLVVGCEPEAFDDGIGLSATVAGVIDDAVTLCLDVITEVCEPAKKEAPA